jgi:hypothetical protein
MSSGVRWLGIVLPNTTLAVSIHWEEIGAGGFVFFLIFFGAMWGAVESCNIVRKNERAAFVLASLVKWRHYEARIITILLIAWLFILVIALVSYLQTGMVLMALIEIHWTVIQEHFFLKAVLTQLIPFLIVITGSLVGFNFDSARR